jgi:hypothetical protein
MSRGLRVQPVDVTLKSTIRIMFFMEPKPPFPQRTGAVTDPYRWRSPPAPRDNLVHRRLVQRFDVSRRAGAHPRPNVESARSRSPESVDLARRDHYKAMPILHFPPGDGIKRRRSEECRCEPSAELAANGLTVLRRAASAGAAIRPSAVSLPRRRLRC